MNIDIEIEKLGRFVNINEIIKFEDYVTDYDTDYNFLEPKIKYLLYVLELTHNNSKIEMYFEQLLKNYSAIELNDLYVNGSGFTILHFMIYELSNISFNIFDIIINFGIDVNSQDECQNTPLHLAWYTSLEHIQNVIGLFVKHGVDLNILNHAHATVLDKIINERELDEGLRILIMTLIDFGAKTNNPRECVDILEFIESYRSSSIKPAIKK